MGCGVSSDNLEGVVLPGSDQFTRKQLIGVGHHGRIYRCIRQVDKKQLAVKVISQLQSQSNSTLTKEKCLQLIDRLKQLKNVRIAEYTHIQLDEKELSIVMEFAREGTLKKYIQQQGKLTEEITSQLIRQVLEGLYYLHCSEVIHKDLKSSNILMCTENTIKLSDFSLAQIYDDRLKKEHPKIKKQNQFYRGDSLPYMAPEVIFSTQITKKSDIWSVGCAAIEMLTGKVPWSNVGSNFQQALKTITGSTHPPLPSNLSFDCLEFLKSCLAVNPSKRPTVKELLKHHFVNKNGKDLQKFFEATGGSVALKQQNGNSNRDSYRQKIEEYKTPTSIQKKYPDQNFHNSKHNYSQSSKTPKQQKFIEGGSKQEALKRMQKISGNDLTTLSREDILPQINEDEEDHLVVVNNKKVKMTSPATNGKAYHLKGHSNFKTQPANETSREYRNSMEIEQMSPTLNDSSHRNQSAWGQKMDTEPTILAGEVDSSKDYFKRPLKLLKKKMNDRKRAQANNSTNFTGSWEQNQSVQLQEEILKRQKRVGQKEAKIRSNTESSREQIIIDTQLARAERDRYVNQQVNMRKQREEQKARWEVQLKKEAEVLKKELSHRYAYPYPGIPA